MDFGKIFSHALKYPLNVQVFVLMLAVNFVFSYSGVYLITLTNPANVSSLLTLGMSIIPVLIVSALITIFLMAMYIDNAGKYFSGGRKPLLSSLPAAKKKFLRLLGTYVLMIIILGVTFLPALVSVGLASGFIAPPLLGAAIGLVALFVAAFFISLAPYIAVLDKFGVFGSLKASFHVVKRNKLNMLVFWIVYLVLSVIISLLSLPITLGYALSLASVSPTILILQSLISTYTALFAYSAFTNFYLSVKKK